MANFRGHITVSGLLGVGYGVGAVTVGGFTPIQGALAGGLTTIGGLLPDLDLENSTPSRELFGLAAAVAPLVLMPHLARWGGSHEAAICLAVAIYLGIRYFGATLFGKLSVHRGMFHSIPAMLIVAELMFLGYPADRMGTRVLMSGAVAAGFLSHLILDELFSVQFTGIRLKLAKSAGSAMKLVGSNLPANILAYTLLGLLTYGVFVEAGWMAPIDFNQNNGFLQQVERATEAINR